MPILSGCKGAAFSGALVGNLECFSIPFMRIYLKSFTVSWIFLFGMYFAVEAQEKSAIQKLYQLKNAENIAPRPLVSTPIIQSLSIVTPVQRATSNTVPTPVRRIRPPPPVTRSHPVERAKPDPSVFINEQMTPQFKTGLLRGLPVSEVNEDTTKAIANVSKSSGRVKPKEFSARERQYLEHANRLDQEASELWWNQRYTDVDDRYREALRYREVVLGHTHPDVAYSLIRLARLYWGSNRTREATVLHRRALTILENRLGSESAELANAFWEYGGILQLRGDYASAVSFMEKAIKVLEKDPNSQTNISQRRMTYATVLSELGRSEEAANVLGR